MKISAELSASLNRLGITRQHCLNCKLPAYRQATDLVPAEKDIFDRPQQMTSAALENWKAMRQAAALENIKLQLVSAYRSIDYQCGIIQRKLDTGQEIDVILKVNAIPGFSEHHTGYALDLTTPDCPPLEVAFEETSAYRWLTSNAETFQFYLSYPKNNKTGIIYEPWHWACKFDQV